MDMISATVNGSNTSVDMSGYADEEYVRPSMIANHLELGNLGLMGKVDTVLRNKDEALDLYHTHDTEWYNLQRVTVGILPFEHQMPVLTQNVYNVVANVYIQVTPENFSIYIEDEGILYSHKVCRAIGCARKTLKALISEFDLL